jgi:hypothetical protein
MPRLQQKLDIIIRKLRDMGFLVQFTLNDWIKACAMTVGYDKRTWRKYLDYALKLHRVKYIAGHVYEIV